MTFPFVIFMLIAFYSTAISNEIVPGTNYQKFLFSFSILQKVSLKKDLVFTDLQIQASKTLIELVPGGR